MESGSVRAVDRALRLLECLATARGGLTLTRASEQAQLNKATTLRFLRTMERRGFVASMPGTKKWRVGASTLNLIHTAQSEQSIGRLALPHMLSASRECGETIQLGVLMEGEVVYVEKIEPPGLAFSIKSEVGSRRPIHCTGLGKALAAALSSEEIEALVREKPLRSFTPRTLTDLPALEEELARVRANGYATSDREYNEMVVCASAPIFDISGRTVAAVSATGVGISLDTPKFESMRKAIVSAAGRISGELGFAKGA